MGAGNVSFIGLSNIILIENTINKFTYSQMFLYFKEYFDNYRKKLLVNYNLKKEEVTQHKQRLNKNLIKKSFKIKKGIP